MNITHEELAKVISEFAIYLKTETETDRKPTRKDVLQFAIASAAFEKWFQFELGAWLNAQNGWNVQLEAAGQDKTYIDIWAKTPFEGEFLALELKCIFNNKNCYEAIWELRNDVTLCNRIPAEKDGKKVLRAGLAVVVHLNYREPQDAGYSKLKNYDPPEKFHKMVFDEFKSTHRWYTEARALVPVQNSEKIDFPQIQKETQSNGLLESSIQLVLLKEK